MRHIGVRQYVVCVAFALLSVVIAYNVNDIVNGYENTIVIINKSDRDLEDLLILLDNIAVINRQTTLKNALIAISYKGSLVDKVLSVSDKAIATKTPFTEKLNATARSGACLVIVISNDDTHISWNTFPYATDVNSDKASE